MMSSLNLELKEIIGYGLTVLATVFAGVWACVKWLLSGLQKKLDKIDELDGTITALKPKLDGFGDQLTNLTKSMVEVEAKMTKSMGDIETKMTKSMVDIEVRFNKSFDELEDNLKKTVSGLEDRLVKSVEGINDRLEKGNERFNDQELKIERSKRDLLETLMKATAESRQYHDQANEDFVRKEDLEDKIRSTTGKFCNENCHNRK